ncbi:MAG: thioredoxin family protein [Vulcanimicrobiota bacterium]
MERLRECNPQNLSGLLANPEPLLLHFGTDWCTPCKRLERVLQGLSDQLSAQVAKVNVEDYPEIAQRFSVTRNPTLCLLVGGELAEKHEGYLEPDLVLAFVRRHTD